MRFLRAEAARDDRATLAWINPDAAEILAEAGLTMRSDSSVDSFVMSRFARRLCPFGEDEVLVDLYGSSGTTRFGGSGRAGIVNGMQVKGIGPTELVAESADWHHSHGGMFLEEALREAIFSELAHREFPLGAVRTVAVIETGDGIVDRHGVRHRGALLVRPFVARACHLERALGFRQGNQRYRSTAHLRDIGRVLDWMTELEFGSQDCVDSFARKAGVQIAHAHVARWFHGGWYSSVMGMDGRLVDFGSSRKLSNWKRRSYETYGPCFGDELDFAQTTIGSLGAHIRHYAGRYVEVKASVQALMHSYRAQVLDELERALADGSVESEAAHSAVEFFYRSFQCSHSEDFKDRWRCLVERLRSMHGVVTPAGFNQGRSGLGNARYRRELVQEALFKVLDQSSQQGDASLIQLEVDGWIGYGGRGNAVQR